MYQPKGQRRKGQPAAQNARHIQKRLECDNLDWQLQKHTGTNELRAELSPIDIES
jgi:hypothetical protein